MSDSAAVPVRRGDDVAREKDKTKAVEPVAAVSSAGPRKLVRPRLAESLTANRRIERVSAIAPLSAPTGRTRLSVPTGESSHAEAFYFQKQIQSQTLMIFVLEDGQQIEGYIEWYDRHCIKVKHGHRTLIYKSSLKYLYKAAEQTSV